MPDAVALLLALDRLEARWRAHAADAQALTAAPATPPAALTLIRAEGDIWTLCADALRATVARHGL